MMVVSKAPKKLLKVICRHQLFKYLDASLQMLNFLSFQVVSR